MLDWKIMSDKCDKCGQAKEQSDSEFMAERADTFRMAHALLKDLGYVTDDDAGDSHDCLALAYFLSGVDE